MELVEEARASRSLPAPPLARAIRLAAGISQQRLADELGVHVQSVIRWERGSCSPRGPLRARYARLLNELSQVVS